MCKKNSRIRLLLTFLAITLIQYVGNGQEVINDFQTRTEVKLSFKPLKNLKINFTPELRFNNNLQFDQYLVEGEAAYSPLKLLTVGAAYRFRGNLNKSSEINYFNRYELYTEVKKKIERFSPAFQLKYSNSDDDESNHQFMRYKATLDYNIRKCKLTPELGVEAFHDLSESNFYKMRYIAGLDFKLFKNNWIGLTYKFDYYLQEYRNKHIFSIGYKIKF